MTTHDVPGVPAKRQRSARVPADQRRAEILVAALDVFGARGYHKAALSEIAERVGITHQGILHHFGSKDQLLVEVLEYRDATDVADFENQEPPHGPELMRHLVRTARANTERAGLVQSYAVLSAESVTDGHPAQASFRDRFTHLRGLIRDALRDSCPSDGPSDAEVDAAASSIIAVMDGLQIQWLLDPERVDMPYAVGLVIDALLARLGSDHRAGDSR
ncbi:TetR/AcrR family transcriptional regulator [Mumia sp. Pv 4-285]|uniref:TetR/AcrR family transcriptional regulator n=1 Tax=Mumia qirimensis TaxID=3234852 RepID=UPI00351D5E8F